MTALARWPDADAENACSNGEQRRLSYSTADKSPLAAASATEGCVRVQVVSWLNSWRAGKAEMPEYRILRRPDNAPGRGTWIFPADKPGRGVVTLPHLALFPHPAALGIR